MRRGFEPREPSASRQTNFVELRRQIRARCHVLDAGLLWPWLKRMHLFHLPGDIVIDRPGFKFFFRSI
jgi:hypothetical protein